MTTQMDRLALLDRWGTPGWARVQRLDAARLRGGPSLPAGAEQPSGGWLLGTNWLGTLRQE
jgi:hypothetical protein